jgi:hypothetical protein
MLRRVLITAAVMAVATAAQAVSVTGAFGAPDPPLPAGQTMVWDFDGIAAAGYSWTGGLAVTNTTTSAAAAPAGTAAGTNYGYVSSALTPNTATFLTPNLSSISFYWGSIDLYNSVDVLGAGGATIFSISGSALPPSNGNQSASETNRRVNFIAGAGEIITGLKFTSTGIAFEFDSFAAEAAGTGTGTAVPEPASWAMLIAGFGLVGAARRRRNVTVCA